MKIKSFVHKNLIVMEFPTLENLRKATFRYAFYQDVSRPRFMKMLKNEETWGFYSDDATDFSKKIKLHQPTREESQFQRSIAKLTKGRYSKYSLIIIPRWYRIEILTHELTHFLYSHYKSYRDRSRKIALKLKKLPEIQKFIKDYNNYEDSELMEETVAYLSSQQNTKVPHKKLNAETIKKLRSLYNIYITRFFGDAVLPVSVSKGQ
jgi:hypothetical protein